MPRELYHPNSAFHGVAFFFKKLNFIVSILGQMPLKILPFYILHRRPGFPVPSSRDVLSQTHAWPTNWHFIAEMLVFCGLKMRGYKHFFHYKQVKTLNLALVL